jgi:hypothetical protein
MKPGLLCRTNQELALGTMPNTDGALNENQRLSSIWKYKSVGLIVSAIKQQNRVCLYIVHSNGTGWISYEIDTNPFKLISLL